MPLNRTMNAPVLMDYRKESGNLDAVTFDLMKTLIKEFATNLPGNAFPILMPFLSLEDPNLILTQLHGYPEITHVLACLTSHLLGITSDLGRHDSLDDEKIKKALLLHFRSPIPKVYLMRDYIKEVLPSMDIPT